MLRGDLGAESLLLPGATSLCSKFMFVCLCRATGDAVLLALPPDTLACVLPPRYCYWVSKHTHLDVYICLYMHIHICIYMQHNTVQNRHQNIHINKNLKLIQPTSTLLLPHTTESQISKLHKSGNRVYITPSGTVHSLPTQKCQEPSQNRISNAIPSYDSSVPSGVVIVCFGASVLCIRIGPLVVYLFFLYCY